MIRKLFILIFILISSITMSLAQEYFKLADQELNDSYNQLMERLSTPQQKLLRDAQRLWINYTDADCKIKAELANTEFTQCKTKATLERAQEFINDFQAKVKPQLDLTFTKKLRGLLVSLETIFAQEQHPGPYTITTKLLGEMSFYYVSKAYGKPIFHAGPHDTSRFNYSSTIEFGHYDPAFLTWLEEHLATIFADQQFITQTKPAVNNYLLDSAELFLTTYYYLKDNPDVYKQLLEQYKNQYQQRNLKENYHYAFYVDRARKNNPNWDGYTKSQQYIWEYLPAETQYQWMFTELNKKWYYAQNGTAIFFWMRRAIDGTDKQFINLLIEFYQAYDPEKLAEITSKNYQIPSHLPLGIVSF